MAKSNPETIVIKSEPLLKEGKATSEIYPGHLVALTGEAQIGVQTAPKTNVRRAIALENDLLGKSINDAYAVDENVVYGAFYQGQEAYVRVAANAEALVVGDGLESAGDGTVRKVTDGIVIGYAMEAKDNSSNSSEVFIKVEVA